MSTLSVKSMEANNLKGVNLNFYYLRKILRHWFIRISKNFYEIRSSKFDLIRRLIEQNWENFHLTDSVSGHMYIIFEVICIYLDYILQIAIFLTTQI